VFILETLIGKFIAIDRFATSAVAAGKITALKHELRDHTVEGGTLITITILASRELSEVSRGSGDVGVV